MPQMFRSLWRYRYFILTSIITDFRTRFAKSKLGAFWMVLNPLAQVVMYAVVLSAVLESKMPGSNSKFSYAIYLLSGMACWSLLSELIFRTTSMFIDNSNLIKKIVFPKLALPSIVVGTALVNNILFLITVIISFIILGQGISSSLVWLPSLIFLTILTGTGIGLILGVINVFIRDVGQILPIAMQFAFWFTPIVYPSSAIPQAYHRLLMLNPFYSIVECYHSILVLNVSPAPDLIFISIVTSFLLVSLGLLLFKRASTEIVDAL